jgi:hypothetical protein
MDEHKEVYKSHMSRMTEDKIVRVVSVTSPKTEDAQEDLVSVLMPLPLRNRLPD